MSLEFERLSDVTLVQEATETANVLIEEGGEIKRVPKTEVGGAGNSEWDAVFEFTADGFILISGDYQTVRDKIIVQKEEPRIKFISFVDDYGQWHTVTSSVSVLVNHVGEDDEYMLVILHHVNGYSNDTCYSREWNSDNSINNY